MLIVTSEYIFQNPNLYEINNIIDNTILEHNKKYGDVFCRNINVKYNIKFSDKIQNKTKYITTTCRIKKTIIASQERYEYIKVNKLINSIEGENVINIYMKLKNIPRF